MPYFEEKERPFNLPCPVRDDFLMAHGLPRDLSHRLFTFRSLAAATAILFGNYLLHLPTLGFGESSLSSMRTLAASTLILPWQSTPPISYGSHSPRGHPAAM
jgi:hypothetical protein